MTVITHLGLKRTALLDTFPHLIELYISQDHDSLLLYLLLLVSPETKR